MPRNIDVCTDTSVAPKTRKTVSRQSPARRPEPVAARPPADLRGEVACDIPYDLPITETEIALVLTLLTNQLDDILRSDETGEAAP